MQPTFVDRSTMLLAGVLERGKPKEMDFSYIWMERFMKFDEFLKPFSPDKAYYGVSFCCGEEGVVDYVAGMVVEGLEQVPEGLVLREIPAAHCAVFKCTFDTIGQTFSEIYGTWLPGSSYELDQDSADYEFYPPQTETGESPVFIYVPVQLKETAPSSL